VEKKSEKKNKISSKSVQWEPSSFMLTDGQTDMTKLILAFRYVASEPKNKGDRIVLVLS
jgi:hypothetical protein